MSLWVQQGYGKGDKLDDLEATDRIGGIVLSPGDESPNTLQTTAHTCSSWGWAVGVDPQTYVYNIPQASGRLHADNGIDLGPLHWGASPDEVRDHARAVVALNRRLGTTITIAPAPLQQSFADVWAPVALQYARAALSEADTPVYASVVVYDTGFSAWADVERWLNEITRLDIEGVYVIVARGQREYPPAWVPDVLANVLRIIYRLAVVNQYRVIWGYSDLAGVLGTAAGATGVASGWFYTLRSFSPSKWQPSTGGQQPVPRVLAAGLLSPLEATSEGNAIARSTEGEEAIRSGDVRRAIAQRPDAWGQTDAWGQHLRALAAIVDNVERRQPGTSAALDYVDRRITMALERLRRIQGRGIAINPAHRTALESFSRALASLRSAERL
jgi:hypothetical protein